MRLIFWLLLLVGSAAANPPRVALTTEEMAGAIRQENFTIPSPGEVFSATDALARPSWPQWVKSEPPPALEDRESIALFIGCLVTDGYVAIEAQDAQAVKNIGKDILSLAGKLNLSQSVMGRAASINDFAQANDWNALREELEATQNEVKLEMAEQKDDRLITLVTVGAWLRAIHLAAQIVAQSWSEETASLLQQPGIVGFLLERMDGLPEPTRAHPSVAAVRGALDACQALISNGLPTKEAAEQLIGITAGGLDQISEKKGKKK